MRRTVKIGAIGTQVVTASGNNKRFSLSVTSVDGELWLMRQHAVEVESPFMDDSKSLTAGPNTSRNSFAGSELK